MAYFCKLSDFSAFRLCVFHSSGFTEQAAEIILHGVLDQTVSVVTYCFMSENYYIASASFLPYLPVHSNNLREWILVIFFTGAMGWGTKARPHIPVSVKIGYK
jgi:hypothetical protein